VKESNDAIRIRAARSDDLADLVAFNKAMAIETEGKELDDATIRDGVRNALADPGRARYYVAEVDGDVAGQTMITLEWSDWRNAFFWWIQSVYVKPEHRRRGVFRALHAFVRSEARRTSGVCGLRLYVYDQNDRAISIYGRLGMTRTQYLLFEEEWSAP
jgi:GNAT superfamily N-acetyltransferase